MRKSLIAVGLAAASLATMAGLTGCGIGHSGPDAAAIVKADGYPVTPQPSSKLLPQGASQMAEGVQGSDAEVVIIVTSTASGNALYKSFTMAGLVNTSLNGSVLKIDATTQQLADAGSWLNANT
jgi:hypothetical protein